MTHPRAARRRRQPPAGASERWWWWCYAGGLLVGLLLPVLVASVLLGGEAWRRGGRSLSARLRDVYSEPLPPGLWPLPTYVWQSPEAPRPVPPSVPGPAVAVGRWLDPPRRRPNAPVAACAREFGRLRARFAGREQDAVAALSEQCAYVRPEKDSQHRSDRKNTAAPEKPPAFRETLEYI